MYSSHYSTIIIIVLHVHLSSPAQLFRALSIRIVLVGAVTLTDALQIPFTSDPDTLLDHFVLYKPKIAIPHDAAMLIT